MIRKALPNEPKKHKEKIIDLLFQIFNESNNPLFSNENKVVVINLLTKLFSVNNHFFSYEYFIVSEDSGDINAIATIYHNNNIYQLKLNTWLLIKDKISNININSLEINDKLSNENEIYIDVLIVDYSSRNLGIGTKIVDFLKLNSKNNKNTKYLSLNVSVENLNAMRFYQRQLFKKTTMTKINNYDYYHLVFLLT